MKLYLGIDMAKHDFASAIESSPPGISRTGDGSIKRSSKKLGNNRRGWNEIKSWVLKEKSRCKADAVHMGVESTGGYETEMVNWMRMHSDFEISLLNPIQVKRFIQSQLIRTKNDRK